MQMVRGFLTKLAVNLIISGIKGGLLNDPTKLIGMIVFTN